VNRGKRKDPIYFQAPIRIWDTRSPKWYERGSQRVSLTDKELWTAIQGMVLVALFLLASALRGSRG